MKQVPTWRPLRSCLARSLRTLSLLSAFPLAVIAFSRKVFQIPFLMSTPKGLYRSAKWISRGLWWCDGEERELSWSSWSCLDQDDATQWVITVATVKSTESRVVDRGFRLQTSYIEEVFSCGEADGGFWVGLGKGGRERMVRHQATERWKGREKIKEENGRGLRGARHFIDVESGGWPMHTPCLMRRAPNPGGQTPALRLLLLLNLYLNL